MKKEILDELSDKGFFEDRPDLYDWLNTKLDMLILDCPSEMEIKVGGRTIRVVVDEVLDWQNKTTNPQ